MATLQAPSIVDRWARAPFYFNSAAHILRIGREQATNLNELLEGLRTCPSDSIDYAVLEKTSPAVVIPLEIGWSDVGSWAVLWNLWPKDPAGNVCIQGEKRGESKVLTLDSSGCLVRGEKSLIAVLGLKDTVVVEAGDALLVCPRDRSQDVRRVIQELKERGWRQYL